MQQRAEFRRRQVARPHGLARGVQKVGDLDARDRGRILKREEEAGARALVGCQRQQVLAVERAVPLRDVVVRMAGQREGERRLAAAVGPHEGVDCAPARPSRSMPLRISLPATLQCRSAMRRPGSDTRCSPSRSADVRRALRLACIVAEALPESQGKTLLSSAARARIARRRCTPTAFFPRPAEKS